MAIDYNWMSQGGVLSDYTGDIAFGTSDQGTLQLVYSRLKAALTGWKANMRLALIYNHLPGIVIDNTSQLAIQKNITLAFIKSISFQMDHSKSKLQLSGNEIDIYVFLNSGL